MAARGQTTLGAARHGAAPAGSRVATDGERRTRSPSLRTQLALVVALLALLPSLVMVVVTVFPAYRRTGALSAADVASVLAWLAAFVLMATLVGYVVSGQLLGPLLRLNRDLGHMKLVSGQLAGERLAVRPDEPQEVRALVASFNELLDEVAREQGRRAAFSAALMHDLKTPLVAAANLLSVVRDEDGLGREQRVEVMRRTALELQALIELVQKMVDAHRLERPEVPLAREEVDLRALMDLLVDRLAPLAEERGVRVEVTGQARANVDRREVERALYNLVSNAVRYAASTIRIEVFPGLVRIADDGPGLGAPLDELAQPFNDQGVSIAGKRYAAGAGGLGLFIARRVLEAHGGRLVAESSGPRGTALLAYLGPS
ncbi:MAG TPA: ATP-binding protein [Trueperaceae bacterium]